MPEAAIARRTLRTRGRSSDVITVTTSRSPSVTFSDNSVNGRKSRWFAAERKTDKISFLVDFGGLRGSKRARAAMADRATFYLDGEDGEIDGAEGSVRFRSGQLGKERERELALGMRGFGCDI